MATEARLEVLADSVGLEVEALDAFELLDDEDITHLAQALEAAEQRQSQALEAAITQALTHVPALLRKPILKILGR